jgi:hypothetical protein
MKPPKKGLRAPFVATFAAVLLVPACGGKLDPQSGAGGLGGMPLRGDPTNPASCPAFLPTSGGPCAEGLECRYAAPPNGGPCPNTGATTATCEGQAWQLVSTTVSCNPPAPDVCPGTMPHEGDPCSAKLVCSFAGACGATTTGVCNGTHWMLSPSTPQGTCTHPPPPPSSPDCATLCNEVGDVTGTTCNCVGANAVYKTKSACLAMCAAFPLGTSADTSGDTVGCRIYHGGGPSFMAPAVHCQHAGPFGYGICAPLTVAGGTNVGCQAFCEIQAKICSTNYARIDACLADCQTYPFSNTPASSNPITAVGPTSGNTFECRAYHLTAAADNPIVHCPHTLPMSATCQ